MKTEMLCCWFLLEAVKTGFVPVSYSVVVARDLYHYFPWGSYITPKGDNTIPQITVLFERAQPQIFSASVTAFWHLFNPQKLPTKAFSLPIPNNKQNLRKQTFFHLYKWEKYIYLLLYTIT